MSSWKVLNQTAEKGMHQLCMKDRDLKDHQKKKTETKTKYAERWRGREICGHV